MLLVNLSYRLKDKILYWADDFVAENAPLPLVNTTQHKTREILHDAAQCADCLCYIITWSISKSTCRVVRSRNSKRWRHPRIDVMIVMFEEKTNLTKKVLCHVNPREIVMTTEQLFHTFIEIKYFNTHCWKICINLWAINYSNLPLRYGKLMPQLKLFYLYL